MPGRSRNTWRLEKQLQQHHCTGWRSNTRRQSVAGSKAACLPAALPSHLHESNQCHQGGAHAP